LPSARVVVLDRGAQRLALGCAAKGMTVVVPPQAAERVPVSKSSAMRAGGGIGWSRWQCASTPPGVTVRPAASISRAPCASCEAQLHDAAAADADVAVRRCRWRWRRARCGSRGRNQGSCIEGK
jgi:hypothetical protein